MTSTEDKPVDREAWQRLLDGEGDGPPKLTDARIRAAARRALAPRSGRWWLPASLAASLLLAVVLVQWQYDRPGAPAIISESNYAVPPAEAPAPARRDEQAPDQSLRDAPATPTAERSVPQAGAEPEQEFRPFAPAPHAVPPPQIELPAAKESRATDEASSDAAKREEDLSDVTVTGSRRRESTATSSTPVTGVTQQDLAGNGAGIIGQLHKSREVLPSPEDWYAEIEKLRAAGKKEDADRELKDLEIAYPGWVEKNHPPDR